METISYNFFNPVSIMHDLSNPVFADKMCSITIKIVHDEQYVTLTDEQGFPVQMPPGVAFCIDGTGEYQGLTRVEFPTSEYFIRNYAETFLEYMLVIANMNRTKYTLKNPITKEVIGVGHINDVVYTILVNLNDYKRQFGL